MATINLLPWRQERRQELKKQFLIITGIFAGVAAVFIVIWHLILLSAISTQEDRNKFMDTRIAELDEQVKEISELKTKKDALIERMKVIQSLQGNRPEIVHIFDELVRTLPDGAFYLTITRTGTNISLTGIAESNNRVSSLMRQLDASELFSNPVLEGVSSDKALGDQSVNFKMKIMITPPVDETAEENGKEKTKTDDPKKK